MRSFDTPLPIDVVLDELARTLAGRNAAVLVAPPGAGKTTRVPLALLDEPWTKGKKDHRAGAAPDRRPRQRRADGEDDRRARRRDGRLPRPLRLESVARARGSRSSPKASSPARSSTIPSLNGVAAVLFDEFHERSLDADLGLALALDAQTGLREELRILVMSATLDGARVAKLLGDAPVIASEGRAFPVETRYLGRKPDAPLERQMAEAIALALRADPGSVLAFLPGPAEIRRTQNFLAERIHDAAVEIVPLFGALEASVQDRAIQPAPKGHRKVVLATSIAETSLTIEGVRIVVDFRHGAGAALRARHRADAAGDRARLARRGRPAPRPRRPHRARRVLPAVGRTADRLARGLYASRKS